MSEFSRIVLHTPRLVLRPLGPADAEPLFGIFSDPRVMRYWSTPPWASLADAQALVARDLAAMAAGDYLRLGLQRRSDDRLVGNCTLFEISSGCRRAEVGYGLAADAWGQGLMHEALTALLTHGFGPMELNRVEADIDPRNRASARALERLGFQCEGRLRERWIVAGEVSDSDLYGLLARDWRPGAGVGAGRSEPQ